MSLARTLIRNVVSNWVGYAVQVVVAFALTPFILHTLGQTDYGIWTLIMSLTGYYGLLDFGLSAGLTQYLTRYLANRDVGGLNRTASSGFFALSFCGALVLIGSGVLALTVDSLFKIPQTSASEVTLVIAINGLSIALQFAFFTFSAVFTATQRFDLSNGVGIATRIFSALLTVWSLRRGYGLVGLSAVVAATNLTDYICRWLIATRWLVPELKISRAAVSRESIKEVLSFGVWNFALASGARLISYTDSLIIAAYLPVAAIAPFAIAANLRNYFEEIFVRVGFVFYPAAAELDAKADRDGLRSLYLVSSKVMFLGAISCGMIAVTWAQSFFRLWLGAEFAASTTYGPVASLFYVLVGGSIISIGQRIGYQVLLGMREVRTLSLLFAVQGVFSIVMTILLIGRYGLMGVSLSASLAAAVCQGVLQPYVVCRLLHVTASEYFRQVLLRPLVLLLVLLSLAAVIFLASILPANWGEFVLFAFLNCMIVMPITVLIGLSRIERQRFVSRPFQALVVKLGGISTISA